MPYLNTIPVQSQVAMLNRLDAGKDPQDILWPALSMLSGKMALVSSFGTDSVVLLHMVAQIAPDTQVLFIDTKMLFHATLGYQKQVAEVLELTDVRRILPDPGKIFLGDIDGLLHQADTDACLLCVKSRHCSGRWSHLTLESPAANSINPQPEPIWPHGKTMVQAGLSSTHWQIGAKTILPPILSATTSPATRSARTATPPSAAHRARSK